LGISVVHSEDVADTHIVREALNLCNGGQPMTIIGDDTDLLVILAATAKPTDNVYILKSGTGTKQSKVINCQTMLRHLGELRLSVLFIHVMTGCDTTSAMFRKGKRKPFQLMKRCSDLYDITETFQNPESAYDVISKAGEKFLLRLYGATHETTLDDLRFSLYVKATAKLALTFKFSLASLPPTSDAARQHSLRVYLQVQSWLGIKHEPTDYEWKLVNSKLIPITTTVKPVPDDILNLVSCSCKTMCNNSCGCLRLGLHCYVLCGHCQ